MSERFYGLYKGTCVNNIDPEGLNRIVATVPTVFTDPMVQTDWAWPMFPPGLAISPPLPNSGVWIGFEGGDTQYPYWSGVWSNTATTGLPYDPLGAAAAAQAAAQAASDPLGSATAAAATAQATSIAISETYTNGRTITGIVTSVNGQNCWLNNTLPAVALFPYVPTNEDVAIGVYVYKVNSATPTSVLYLIGTVPASSGAWTPYTPVWGATVTNPTLGNGTLLGRYQMLGPKTCAVRFQVTAGSTTTVGSGTYTWTLPFTTSASIGAQTGTGLLDNPGAGVLYNGIWLTAVNSTSTTFLIPNGAGASSTQVGNTVMANGVFILGSMVYEIA